MYKYVDAVLREDLAPLTEHMMLTRSQERALAPLTEHNTLNDDNSASFIRCFPLKNKNH